MGFWFYFILAAIQSLQTHYPLDSVCCLIVCPKVACETKFMVASLLFLFLFSSFCFNLMICKSKTELLGRACVLIGDRKVCTVEGKIVIIYTFSKYLYVFKSKLFQLSCHRKNTELLQKLSKIEAPVY